MSSVTSGPPPEVYWGELWPAGVALADAVLGGRIPVPEGEETVVDLGCGTGIAAIAAAKAANGKAVVLAMDREPRALALASMNAERNGMGSDVRARHVDWGRPYSKQHDLILAADCLYHPDSVKMVLKFIQMALAHSPGAQAVLADPDRWSARDFEQLAQDAGFVVNRKRHITPFTAVHGPIEWLPESGPPTDSARPLTDDGVEVSLYELRWR
jgi:predicted nicotinamide N-methyase